MTLATQKTFGKDRRRPAGLASLMGRDDRGEQVGKCPFPPRGGANRERGPSWPSLTPTPTPTTPSPGRSTFASTSRSTSRRSGSTGGPFLELASPAGGPMDLDTKGLTVSVVTGSGGGDVPFETGPDDPILGRRLRLTLPAGTTEVLVKYHTAEDAVALQWLDPAQTEGKKHPYLFSQCQAIHARSMVPCQDTARFRVTYHAEVTVPEALSAVMSAGPVGTCSTGKGTRTFLFDMPQPIPPYLLALAVGDLESRDLSPRARVWAEPATVEKAAWEFAGVEEMIVEGRGALRPLRLGPLRHARPPAVVPLRRHGEPADDVPDADAPGGRPLARRRRRARARALLDRATSSRTRPPSTSGSTRASRCGPSGGSSRRSTARRPRRSAGPSGRRRSRTRSPASARTRR